MSTEEHGGQDARSHIAQLNIARALFDFNDPRMAAFLSLVDHVNAAADRAPGFVWRLQDSSGKLNRGRDAREIVNLSVWQDVKALRDFVFSGVHKRAISKRGSWFMPLPALYSVMWRVPPGHLPTIEEGFGRLEILQRKGSCEAAFDWMCKEQQP
jgi:heme-degrading monooxygenase HmoA